MHKKIISLYSTVCWSSNFVILFQLVPSRFTKHTAPTSYETTIPRQIVLPCLLRYLSSRSLRTRRANFPPRRSDFSRPVGREKGWTFLKPFRSLSVFRIFTSSSLAENRQFLMGLNLIALPWPEFVLKRDLLLLVMPNKTLCAFLASKKCGRSHWSKCLVTGNRLISDDGFIAALL